VKTSFFFNNSHRVLRVFFLCAMMIMLPVLICAAEKDPDRGESLHITADTMVSQKERHRVEFSGSVVAAARNSTIQADKLTVRVYTEEEKRDIAPDKEQTVKTITASGNVQYTSGSRKAFADKAVYTSKRQTLVLTGKAPRVTTGKSFVTGEKITLFEEDGRIVVEGGHGKRVEALFNSRDRTE